MIIDLTKLKDELEINMNYEFSKEQLESTEIIEIKDFNLQGRLSKYSTNEYSVNLVGNCTLVLPSSLALSPTDVQISFTIDDDLNILFEEIGQNIEKNTNSLDIFPIIWENILMEIPMKVINPNDELEQTSGDGWKLLTDDEPIKVNQELEKLKDLL